MEAKDSNDDSDLFIFRIAKMKWNEFSVPKDKSK